MVSSIGGSQGSVGQVLQDSQKTADKQKAQLNKDQETETQRIEQLKIEQNRIDDARRGNKVDVTV